MDLEPDTVSWWEQGVNNWARDLGFTVTKASGRYALRTSSQHTILENVELDDIEHYLGEL